MKGNTRNVPQRELNRWAIYFHIVTQHDKEPQATLFAVFPFKLLQQIKGKRLFDHLSSGLNDPCFV
jgi:hypothetical protein